MDLSDLEPGRTLMERRVAVTAERAAAYAAALRAACRVRAAPGFLSSV